jgi:hypothetical protein
MNNPSETNTTTNNDTADNGNGNNPMLYIIMHNLAILGAYSRPEWAASKVLNILKEERATRDERAKKFKLQRPDPAYLIRAGYDEADELKIVYNPTAAQLQRTITKRAEFLGVTVAGIGSSTYALNIIPVLMDA